MASTFWSLGGLLFLFGSVCSIDVKLESTFNDVTGDLMPEEINVTVSTETDSLTTLHLKRDRDFNLDIPLYTLNTDASGLLVPRKVTTIEKKVLTLYQDKHKKAFFQMSKTIETESKLAKLNMKGDYELGRYRYLLNTDKKANKKSWKSTSAQNISMASPSSSENGDVYVMELLNTENLMKFAATETPKDVRETVMNNVARNRFRQRIRDDLLKVSDRQTRYYSIYRQFLTEAQSGPARALQNILEHYAFAFNWIDQMFASINASFTIHIQLSKVYVLQSTSASYFIDRLVSAESISGDTILGAFRSFSSPSGDGYGIVKGYDHAMLFTRYDLYRSNTYYLQKTYIGSISYPSTMCLSDGSSVSVNRDISSFDAMYNGLRSISFSLSGQTSNVLVNGCSLVNMDETSTFLSCNQQRLSDFLDTTLKTSRGYICLVYAQNTDSDIPDSTGKLPGQLILPDEQCRMMIGKDSYFCRSVKANGPISDICHTMFCSDPPNYTMCTKKKAFLGTSCGDGKICIKENCVYNERAPQVDESCVFGDEPPQPYGIFCSVWVQNNVTECYDEGNRKICRKSCGEEYRSVQGCEFGDRSDRCTVSDCPLRAKDCRATCNYGTPFTPTTTTRRSTQPYSITIKRPGCIIGDPDRNPDQCTSPSICQTNPENCCKYCSSGNANLMKKLYLLHIVLPITAVCFYRRCSVL